MGGYHKFYEGTNYGLDSSYGKSFDTVTAGEFSTSTDPRLANQLKATSDKISSGIKGVEVSLLTTDVIKAIPNQNLEEINRLRKLTGVDLTLHGPLVEPTGVSQQGWDPQQREFAEREMWHTIERGAAISKRGKNEKDWKPLVVTIHSSNGLPAPEIIEVVEGKEKVVNIAVIDQRSGQVGMLPKPKEEFLAGEGLDPYSQVKELNENRWRSALSEINIETSRAKQAINNAFELGRRRDEEQLTDEEKADIIEDYKLSKKNPAKFFQGLNKLEPAFAKARQDYIEELNHGEAYLQQAYRNLREQFNNAYSVAQNEGKEGEGKLKILNEFKEKIAPRIEELKKDSSKIMEMGDDISHGISILQSIDAPESFKPLKKFAVEKAAETFSNVALKSYQKFKEDAPIISIENPPAGSGLSSGKDLRLLVDESRKELARKLEKEEHMSKERAAKEAEKLIGVTWDVGHINMLRKFGYGDKELESETKAIAKMVNKIHLSDNFGFEHSELPMGMGNVPMNEHLRVLKAAHKEKLADIKKVIEVGDWYQHFQTTPFQETLEAFGSPIYAMKMGPYWNQQAQPTIGGYFAGYGNNPDIHHSIYGAGFANLPVELGGQMGGRSRMGGAPID